MKILFAVLVLAAIALIGAVIGAYLKIRKHMREPKSPEHQTSTDRKTDG